MKKAKTTTTTVSKRDRDERRADSETSGLVWAIRERQGFSSCFCLKALLPDLRHSEEFLTLRPHFALQPLSGWRRPLNTSLGLKRRRCHSTGKEETVDNSSSRCFFFFLHPVAAVLLPMLRTLL